MSDESSPKAELPVVSEELQAQIREYQAKRDQEYDDTMRWLESAGIEPEQRAAYDATLTEMLALPVNELAWPGDDPRYRLHRTIRQWDDDSGVTKSAGRAPWPMPQRDSSRSAPVRRDG